LLKIVKAFKILLNIVILFIFFVFQVVSKDWFKPYKYITFKPISSKDNLIIISIKLEVIVLKVGSALGKESLEGSLVSLIRAGLVYLIGLSLLSYVKEINLLLEGCNLGRYILGTIIITNTRES
jgi:hypothetical protein